MNKMPDKKKNRTMTDLEDSILPEIWKTYPFARQQINEIFLKVNSIDKTIKLLHAAMRLGLNPADIIYILDNFSLIKKNNDISK